MIVDELVIQIQQMGYSMGLRSSTMDPIIGKIREMEEGMVKLTAERDEARLEVCNFDNTRFAARQEATKRGWDCYKEEKTP